MMTLSNSKSCEKQVLNLIFKFHNDFMQFQKPQRTVFKFNIQKKKRKIKWLATLLGTCSSHGLKKNTQKVEEKENVHSI